MLGRFAVAEEAFYGTFHIIGQASTTGFSVTRRK